MKMIGKLLCKIGLHKWRDTYVKQLSWSECIVHHKCLRCGETDGSRYWGPLSGPHKPKWHPDADKVIR